MTHQTILYGTNLLPVPANTVGADKIIDVSKRIELNSPKIVRNLSEDKLFVQGKIILQIIYEEKTELNNVKVFHINIPFLSPLPNISDPEVPITVSFEQFSIELSNEYTMGLSYILSISVARELDEPKIVQNNSDKDIDIIENNIQIQELENVNEPVEPIEKTVIQKIANTTNHTQNSPETVFLTSEQYAAVKKKTKEKKLEWFIPSDTKAKTKPKSKSKSKSKPKPRNEQKKAKTENQQLNNNHYKPFLSLKDSKATLTFKNLSNK